MALAERWVSPAGREPLLRVRSLSVRYGARRALDGVDLDVGRGELLALAGENGAGKSSLVRCVAGDIEPSEGQVWMGGRRLVAGTRAAARAGVAVVWQDLALCDNLDVAANLMLGRERRRSLLSDSRFHAGAAAMLEELGIPIADTTRLVGTLSGGQRQLVAVARAVRDRPDLLVLDEPTASLGVFESAQVEALTLRLLEQGTTILLVSHDVDQMFRLADRIAVLRQGRLVADLVPGRSHPDDVLALISGQEIDGSARTQLSRLHGLSDQLASADPGSSLSLILSALGASLGSDQLCIHLLDGERLRVAASLGLADGLARAWEDIPLGAGGGPVGVAAATKSIVVEPDLSVRLSWAQVGPALAAMGIHSSWSVPFAGSGGVAGVVTVLRRSFGNPDRDELDLVNLYAGYAAGAAERDRLLGEVTTRNRILETIREVLVNLAGPVPLEEGLTVALQALIGGVEASEVLLVTTDGDGPATCRACVDRHGARVEPPPAALGAAAGALRTPAEGGTARLIRASDGSWLQLVCFPAPSGPSALVARWTSDGHAREGRAVMEDAASSLRLALEREESERAHREATTLRRSQELQRQFLSRLSHELRTPLTAIRGYASSLMQTDVTWDRDSQERFLERIGAESARLGRLVDDLLDFSAIESNILRLHPDWCDLNLVLDAARSCLPPEAGDSVTVCCPAELPPVWADHDRLEQVFVNLFDNALRHNPAGTRVAVAAAVEGTADLVITVSDDGVGMPSDIRPLATASDEAAPRPRRAPTAGAGLGLSIARGIIDAHGGRISVEAQPRGSRFVIRLPLDNPDSHPEPDHA